MNSRERVLAALHLKEPDRVPFMDFVDTVVKHEIMGTEKIDEVKSATKIGKDAGVGGGYICSTANSITGFCKIENIFAMTEAVRKCGTYPIKIE